MKVQCQKCEKKYNIPDEKIPENGVTLKCKECKATISVKKDITGSHQSSADEAADISQPDIEQSETHNERKNKSKASEISDNLKDSVKHTAERERDTINDKKLTKRNKSKYKSDKSLIGKIEQKVLFNYTRILALVAIGFLLISLTIGVVAYFNVGDTSYVTYNDVEKTLTPPEENAYKSIQDKFPDVKIPKNVLRQFNSNQNKKVLTGWLTGLDKDQQKDFISNLEYIIDEAEDENPGKVTEYINEYKTIKLAKISSNQFDKYYQTATKVGFIALILFLMGIIGLFSLVLVVLAVERNTRPKLQMER